MKASVAGVEQRLAQGIELLDAIRGGRIGHPLRVDLEGPWAPGNPTLRTPYSRPAGWRDPSPGVTRHASCLHTLLYHPVLDALKDAAKSVLVRIYDHERKFVPRRLRIPLLGLTELDQHPPEHRICRPRVYPGAAYDIHERATGLRGRVLRGGEPIAWARIEARIAPGNQIVGHAHGDDRGEFLLLLGSHPTLFNEQHDSFEVELKVHVPSPSTPSASGLSGLDVMAGLPEERLPAPGEPDLVSPGKAPPTGYAPALVQVVRFRLGRITSWPSGLSVP